VSEVRVEIDPRIKQFLLDDARLPHRVELGGDVYTPERAIDGGFKAIVWKARDRRGRARAIKLATYDDYVKSSWERELQFAAPLERHPCFARIESGGRARIPLDAELGTFEAVYFIEDWVEGTTLRDFLTTRESEVDTEFLLNYVRHATRALEVLQAHGLMHDDFHAGNVMLADPAAGDDGLLQVRVIDMGSLKPAEDATKEKADLDHCLDHFVSIYNVIMRGRLASRSERRFLAEVREALDRMADPDRTVALRDPKTIRHAFEYADSRARFQSALPGGRRMTSPFEFISSEHISDDRIFIDLFAETPWLSKVASRDPCLVTGPRGCGKSTLFRWLSLRIQLIRDDPELGRFPIAGFYVSCSTELEGRFSWLADKKSASEWETELIHYFNLVLAGEVLDTLLAMQAYTFDVSKRDARWHIGPGEEESLLGFLTEELQVEPTALGGTSRLRQAAALVAKERHRCDLAMRRSEHLRRTTTETFIADLSSHLVRLIPFFREHRITFLIDDYTRRRINTHVQRVLNKVIWPRREHHIFKASSEKDGAELTDTAGRTLEAARELVTIDVGLEYLSLSDRAEVRQAHAFAAELLDARLHAANYQGTGEQLLGDSDWGDKGSLARALRDARKERSQYHGMECIADLCSGDVATLLLVYRRIFEEARVREFSTDQIPPAVQHQAIRQVSSEQVEMLKDHFPCGPEMRALVTAFGTLVGNILRDGKEINQGPSYSVPPQCPRIEVDDTTEVGEEVVGTTRRLYEELVRRAVFIEMDPGRSRRGHVQTLRWQIRRVYLPTFGAALSKNSAVKLRPAEFKLLLEDPALACGMFWRREPKTSSADDDGVRPLFGPGAA
jgi:serine/threonine protein kinase